MKRPALFALLGAVLLLAGMALMRERPAAPSDLRFEISFPASTHAESLTGRMFLALRMKTPSIKTYEWHNAPITNTRDHETGAVRLTSKQRNTMELVNGTKGRSGQQLDIWSAVFGPVGDDGYFKPLFDKRTG